MKQLMVKYISYYIERIKYPMMEALEYRADIISLTFTSYAYMLIQLIFITVVVNQFGSIGDWGLDDMIILFASGQFILLATISIFINVWDNTETDIEKGNLDFYLLKPINVLFNYSTRGFVLFQNLPSLMFPVILLYFARDSIIFSPAIFILYLVSIFMSMTIFYSIIVILGSLSFWITDSRYFKLILFGLWKSAALYPADIYPNWALPIFLIIIPIGLLAYAPSYFLVFGFNWQLYAVQVFVTIIFSFGAVFIWNKGIKKYSSASS